MTENNGDFIYELPEVGDGVFEMLFAVPNEYTSGAFTMIWVATAFIVFYIGSIKSQPNPNGFKAFLYASFGSFIITLMIVIGSSVAGDTIVMERELIVTTLALILGIVLNYVKGSPQSGVMQANV